MEPRQDNIQTSAQSFRDRQTADKISLVFSNNNNKTRFLNTNLTYTIESRDSSVGIALGYGLDDQSSRARFPAWAGNFSLHHRVQNGSGAHPASYPMRTRGSFPGRVKRPGREADHSPHLVPRPKNEWSYTSTSQYASMAWCSAKAQGELCLLPLLIQLKFIQIFKKYGALTEAEFIIITTKMCH
jgi:hypothetical protein